MRHDTYRLQAGTRLRGKRGNALIQFTLATSLIIPLFLGTWEYGYGFYLYSQLSEAVRSGGRYASVRTYDSWNTPSAAFSTAVANMVVYGDPSGGTTPLVPGLTTSMVTVGSTFTKNIPTSVSVTINGYSLPVYLGNKTLNNNPYVQFPFVGFFGPP